MRLYYKDSLQLNCFCVHHLLEMYFYSPVNKAVILQSLRSSNLLVQTCMTE